MGILKDEEGKILKPYPSKHEVYFYDTMRTTQIPILQQVKKYIPEYYGTRTIQINEDGKIIINEFSDEYFRSTGNNGDP